MPKKSLRIYGRGIPFDTIGDGIEAGCGILQVLSLPGNASIGTACGYGEVRVVALEITGQAVVEVRVLDDRLQCCVVCPLQAEKAGHKVFGTFEHPVFRGGSCNDLGAGIVKMPIVVVVQNS